MSRGPGKLMRKVEAALTDEAVSIWMIAAEVFETDDPTRSQVESARRAAKKLAELERAELVHRPLQTEWWNSEYERTAVTRRFLTVRRPTRDVDRAAADLVVELVQAGMNADIVSDAVYGDPSSRSEETLSGRWRRIHAAAGVHRQIYKDGADPAKVRQLLSE